MKAFTFIEVLVTVTIIAILFALGLPLLNSTLSNGKKVKEISALKNLITSLNLYTTDTGDFIKSYDEKGVAYDINGNLLGEGSHEASRWPWRLAPYFNYNFYGVTLVNDSESYIKKNGGLDQTYLVSVIPSFGMNLFIGGNDYEGRALQSKGFVSTRPSQITKPSQTLAFVSSRSMAANQRFEGFYYVTIPTTKKYDKKSNPRSSGYISARYDEKAVVAYLGGNVSLVNYTNLLDSRLWSEEAVRQNNPNWKP